MKYIVEITETLQKQIKVTADSEVEAMLMVEKDYYNGIEELTAEHLINTKFDVVKEGENEN